MPNFLTRRTKYYPEHNLSNLKQSPYIVKANGYYDKKKPVLEPLDWVKSPEGQKHISKIYTNTETVLYIETSAPLTICTNSYYIWLGYLKHCIGNIDIAISSELAL